MDANFAKRFLTNTDETGRFIVKSFRTGKTYYVEPVGDTRTHWGSIDPATGNLVNKKGHDKYRGSVDEKDSMVTLENGFKKVHTLEKGTSPHHAIDVIDAQYPSV